MQSRKVAQHMKILEHYSKSHHRQDGGEAVLRYSAMIRLKPGTKRCL